MYQSPDFSIISTSWFCDTCSNIFDVEFASFLIFAVSTVTFAVFAAKLLLKNTKLPISEVANNVGYSDSLLFSKTFSRYFSMSPLNYRNNKVNNE